MNTSTLIKLKNFSNDTENFNCEENKPRGFHIILRYISYLLVLLFVMSIASPVQFAKAASLSLKIDGKSSNYTSKQVEVTFDGKAVNMKNTPGIVINGTSYVSYKDVFGSSKLKAKVSYDKTTKTITISKYDKTIVMTLGSTKANVNGVEVTMSGAPINVTYVDKKETKILVPTEFVTKNLGYDYSWSANDTTVTAAIATGLIIRYDGTNYTYTDKQGRISVDGEMIDTSNLPAIILDNTVMVPAKKVFASSTIGAKYKYTKSSKKVTLTLDDYKIEMTLGSKTAIVDGDEVQMDAPARIIKNVVTGNSYVCVPANFIANEFGYDYHWNNTSNIFEITFEDEEEPSKNESSDVLDDTIVTPGQDDTNVNNPNGGTTSDNTVPLKILANYGLLNQHYNVYNYLAGQPLVNISNTASIVGNGFINGITRVYTDNSQDREVYMINSVSQFNEITSYKNDGQIIISANNMMSNAQNYPFNYELVNNIQTTYFVDSMKTEIVLNLNDKHVNYDLTLSEDLRSLMVTVYMNYVGTVEMGTNSNGEFLKLSSLNPITPTVTESADSVNIIIPNTINGVGDINFTNSELSKIKSINVVTINTNDTLITIYRNSNASYFIEQGKDNTYTITFESKENNTVTPTPTPEMPTTPDIVEGNLNYSKLMIPVPSSITKGSVTDEDLYLNQQIKLYLPGDFTSSISSSTIKNESTYVKNIKVSYENGETVITLSTNRICAYDYKVVNGYLCVAVDKPGNVYDKIVVLDAGHGGTDPGARSADKTINEKDLNFKIMNTLVSGYMDNTDIKVYFTRTTDFKAELKDRAAFASKVDADLFISLHMNSSTVTSPSGTEVYYLQNSKLSMGGLTGYEMATTFSKNLSVVMENDNRGAKPSQNLVVLKYNTVPAVLIELGFMSNKAELAKLTNEYYQVSAAECIADTVIGFFEDYSTGR